MYHFEPMKTEKNNICYKEGYRASSKNSCRWHKHQIEHPHKSMENRPRFKLWPKFIKRKKSFNSFSVFCILFLGILQTIVSTITCQLYTFLNRAWTVRDHKSFTATYICTQPSLTLSLFLCLISGKLARNVIVHCGLKPIKKYYFLS